MGVAYDGCELGPFFLSWADLHRGGGLLESCYQIVRYPAYGHEHAACQASLAGVAVGRGYDVRDGLLQYGVWHDDHGVLGPGERLHPLAVGTTVRVDVLGNGLGPDE